MLFALGGGREVEGDRDDWGAGEGTRNEGTGKCIYYHCQRLHAQFIMHKTRSSIPAINKPHSVDALRPCKGKQKGSLSYFLAAVSERSEEANERIGRANR